MIFRPAFTTTASIGLLVAVAHPPTTERVRASGPGRSRSSEPRSWRGSRESSRNRSQGHAAARGRRHHGTGRHHLGDDRAATHRLVRRPDFVLDLRRASRWHLRRLGRALGGAAPALRSPWCGDVRLGPRVVRRGDRSSCGRSAPERARRCGDECGRALDRHRSCAPARFEPNGLRCGGRDHGALRDLDCRQGP